MGEDDNVLNVFGHLEARRYAKAIVSIDDVVVNHAVAQRSLVAIAWRRGLARRCCCCEFGHWEVDVIVRRPHGPDGNLDTVPSQFDNIHKEMDLG